MVAKKITSLQHPLVKHWTALRADKAYMQEAKRVLISGKKMVQEISLETLIVLEPNSSIRCKEEILVTEPILKKITGLVQPDGFAGVALMPEREDLRKKQRVLILDQISDPGNLGTLLRTALALGWEGVIVTPGTVDLFNEKALRAGKGAQFHLPYDQLSRGEIAKIGWHFYTADLEGEALEGASFKAPLALVLSSEGHGAHEWSKSFTKKITIPMVGQVESLNVAASGAILLYEMRKK